MQTMTLEQFRATVNAGAVLSVTLKAVGGAFVVNAETRRGEVVLVTSRDRQPRRFADPRRALLLLRELGIHKTHLDAEGWWPEEAKMLRVSRPDRKEALKQTHQVAAQALWIREQVEEAVRRADSGEAMWHDAEAVFNDLDQRLEARLAGRTA